jgi:hypothetical protein
MATLFGFTRSRSGPGGGTPSRLRKPESEEHQEDKSGVSASTWSGVVCTLLGSGSPDFTWLRPSLQMSKSMDDWDSMLQEIKKWHVTVVQWTVFLFGTVTCFATLKPPVLLPSHKVTVHRCFDRVEVSGSGSPCWPTNLSGLKDFDPQVETTIHRQSHQLNQLCLNTIRWACRNRQCY